MVTLILALFLHTAHANDLGDALKASDSERAAAAQSVHELITPDRVENIQPGAWISASIK